MNTAEDARIQKVRKFGRLARRACTVAMAFSVLLSLPWGFTRFIWPATDAAIDVDLGLVHFAADHPGSFAVRTWVLLIMATGLALFLGMLWLFRRMFDNLARGEIYTRGNVNLLRALGRLLLAGALLRILIPIATIVLSEMRVLAAPASGHFTFSLSQDVLSAFAMAAIVMLVSWIMDIGLGVREEADQLRRDAELVV